jgi:threonine aldolase
VRARKLFGGGMRQVGVLAAAGIVALTEMVGRIGEDHVRARRLAEGLAALPAVEIDPARVYTNILVFRMRPEKVPGNPSVAPSQRLVEGMKEHRVLLGAFGATDVRMVTHYEITDADIETTLRAARTVLA